MLPARELPAGPSSVEGVPEGAADDAGVGERCCCCCCSAERMLLPLAWGEGVAEAVAGAASATEPAWGGGEG